MNPKLRRILFAMPGAQLPYQYGRKLYTRFRAIRRAGRYFSNLADYKKALLEPEEGRTLTTPQQGRPAVRGAAELHRQSTAVIWS
jgi:hypothetical protein